MGRTSTLIIKESESELSKLRRIQGTLRLEKRALALLYLKTGKAETRLELSRLLGVAKRTLETWITTYKRGGIEALLKPQVRRKPSKLITPSIHEALSRRVHDAEQTFLGYWEAQRWLKAEFGVEIKYSWLRKYLISKFGTKVKTARKSHAKKDEEAKADFLKTSRAIRTY